MTDLAVAGPSALVFTVLCAYGLVRVLDFWEYFSAEDLRELVPEFRSRPAPNTTTPQPHSENHGSINLSGEEPAHPVPDPLQNETNPRDPQSPPPPQAADSSGPSAHQIKSPNQLGKEPDTKNHGKIHSIGRVARSAVDYQTGNIAGVASYVDQRLRQAQGPSSNKKPTRSNRSNSF